MTGERRYRIRHCLGKGGFGEVYLAVMEVGAVQTEVAVKLLGDDLNPSDMALERLRDEGRILGVLNHPVILKVHDLQVLRGRIALVTEYVDGADLEQCFAARDLPVRALVEVVGRVADALGVAWTAPSPTGGQLELCHRDVKPANVRLGRHGDVKLLDFGIARAGALPREARTRTESVVGTLAYMAPERFDAGNPSGPEADVYALGAVLYEGLAGERFVEGLTTREVYVLGMDDDDHDLFVQRRIDSVGDAPPALVELLAEMLSHDPAARPSAADVAFRCEQLVEQLPGATLRQYCRERTWEAPALEEGALAGQILTTDVAIEVPRRSRWPWITAAVLLASVLGLGAVAFAAVALLLVLYTPAASPAPAPTAPPIVEPAPPTVPAPGPVEAPAPAPAPPPPSPAAPRHPRTEPGPPEATFAATGDVAVELRAGGRSYGPGPVPAGTLEIWADFGQGPELLGQTSPSAGQSFTIRCSRLRHNCVGAP